MPPSNSSIEKIDHAAIAAADQKILDLRAMRYAREPHVEAIDTQDFVVFEREGARYGIQLVVLREIRGAQRICTIPGTRPAVRGVFYFRGQIVSAHDVASLVDRAEASTTAANWLLIVEHRGECLALLADDLIGIEPVPAARVRPVPITFGEMSDCFRGVLDSGELILSPEGIFDSQKFFYAF